MRLRAVGGEKISTDEVENYILKHPAIRGVAVVAMPDEVLGEKACPFVTLNLGQGLTFDELKEFLLAERIAKFRLPERLEVLVEFPISPAGKILRAGRSATQSKPNLRGKEPVHNDDENTF